MGLKIAVLGAGPGGYVAALRAAQMGGEVTLIEREGVGGTCLNWGCIPSKVLKTTAELLERCRRAGEMGIMLGEDARTDMKALMTRKETVIRNQARGILDLLGHRGVRYITGEAVIEGAGHLAVDAGGEGILDIPWDRLIIAVGSRPLEIPGLPFDGRRILSSNDALSLEEIPESLLIVGGGVIGCEFAFIFGSLGSKVTVVEALGRLLPLPSVDEDCSRVIQREMKKRRISFMVNRTLQGVEEEGDGCRALIGPSPLAEGLKERDLRPQALEVEKVLVCIGRSPNTAGIGLERIGAALDEKGWILADEKLETGERGVYAIGDVLGPSRIMLAHVASREGILAAENAMGARRTMSYDVVPGVVFTTPEVADVGLTEVQAKETGMAVRADSVLFRNLGKAHVIGEIAGEAKIVSDAESGRILGVHIVGPHAGDLIAEAALAIQTGCTLEDLAETIHAHPTLAEIMMEVSMKALGRSLHG